MNDTTTRPRVGQRLTAVTVPHLPEYEGKPFTVTDASGAYLRGEFISHSKPDDFVSLNVSEWEHLNPAVKVGDRIVALHVASVPHAQGRIATTRYDAAEGAREVWCDFEEYVDEGGRVREATQWYVHQWDIAPDEWVPAVGDAVIAYEPNIVLGGGPGYPGVITRIDDQGDSRTVYMVAGEHNQHGIYFYRVEKAPAVEYVPSVGDRVRFTGYLGESGIIDGLEWKGTVTAVEGDIWTVKGITDTFISGPGYVFPLDESTPDLLEEPPAVPVEPAIITDLQAEIDRLTRELGRANERVTEYSDRAGKWERDFGRYANAIIDEAVTRRWCDEYERVISGIESGFEIAEIPTREEDVDIEWEETYTVTVTRRATVSLQRGYTDSDVDDAARSQNSDSDATRDEVLQAVRNGNYSADEYVDESACERM